jgi:S1-C subfamily serine protease
MSRFWRHFLSNGRSSLVESRLGLFGTRAAVPGAADVRSAPTTGVRVRFIQSGGPAEDAGLMEGDVLVSLDERPVPSLTELHRLLRRLPAGLPLPVVLVRGGRRLERWVILNDAPHVAHREP